MELVEHRPRPSRVLPGLALLLLATWAGLRLVGIHAPDDWEELETFGLLLLVAWPLDRAWRATSRGTFRVGQDDIVRTRGEAQRTFVHARLRSLRWWWGVLVARYDDRSVLCVDPGHCKGTIAKLEDVEVRRTARIRPGRLQRLPMDRLTFPGTECRCCGVRPVTGTAEFTARRGIRALVLRWSATRDAEIPACGRCQWRLDLATLLAIAGLVVAWFGVVALTNELPLLPVIGGLGPFLLASLYSIVVLQFGDRLEQLWVFGVLPVWLDRDRLHAWLWFWNVERAQEVAKLTLQREVWR